MLDTPQNIALQTEKESYIEDSLKTKFSDIVYSAKIKSNAKSFNYDDLDIWADDPYAKYDDEPFEEEVAAIEVTKKKEKKRKKKKDSSKPNSKKKLVPFEGYDMDNDDKWFDADFSNFA